MAKPFADSGPNGQTGSRPPKAGPEVRISNDSVGQRLRAADPAAIRAAHLRAEGTLPALMVTVAVEVSDSQPVRFLWKERRLTVTEIADHWSEQGRWWDGESPCELFLVNTSCGLFLLGHQAQGTIWYGKPAH